MTVHYLKIKPEYYKDIECGLKTFELRKNDRNFQVGDILMLIKLNDKGNETDQVTRVKVNYILKDCPQYGLKDGYAILGIDTGNRIGGTIALPNGDVGYIKNAKGGIGYIRDIKYAKLGGYETNDAPNVTKTTITDAAGFATNGDGRTEGSLIGGNPIRFSLGGLDKCVTAGDSGVYYVGDIGKGDGVAKNEDVKQRIDEAEKELRELFNDLIYEHNDNEGQYQLNNLASGFNTLLKYAREWQKNGEH